MEFDVIIVGGGINGAGIARDAAMRGLRVLLLERDDFASGASGKNGRMIHGGLRYLEQFEVGLVREALAERATLLKIAPHLVKRRDLIIPVRSGIGRPGWMVRLGLFALDVLSPRGSVHHRYLNKAEALRRVPSLKADGLQGAAVMFDAFAQYAERLTLENVIDAAVHGAVVKNHTPAKSLSVVNGRVVGVVYANEAGEECVALAPIVLNATGAWADEFLQAATGKTSSLLGPAKGTFIVITTFEGAPDGSVFFEASKDRRPIIVTPWNGLYLVGTTDERVAGAIDDVSASYSEVDYLLAELTHVFPAFNGTMRHVLYTYTGVRPLPRAGGVSAKVPRRHIVYDHAPAMAGLLSILGGKLSTFRSLAEETVDLIVKKLGTPKIACRTATTLLPGAMTRPSGMETMDISLDQRSLLRLEALYGSRANHVIALAKQDRALTQVIDPETGAIGAEIVFAVREEWASTFEDILVRRTMIGRNSSLGANALDRVAEIAAEQLSWSPERIKQNRESYQRYIELSRGIAQSSRLSGPCAIAMGIA